MFVYFFAVLYKQQRELTKFCVYIFILPTFLEPLTNRTDLDNREFRW